jgi:hypothetical protein
MNLFWGFDIEMACDEKGNKKFPDLNNYDDVHLIYSTAYSSPRSKCTLYAGSSQHTKAFPMLISPKK